MSTQRADELMVIAVAIYIVADSAPGDPADPDGLPAALYAEADAAYDVALAMGARP
ncbi:hypothetical protein DFJ67_3848 [Asanoa ferruginea]|uniref:Uncharacterized protein n=1 Tax=Asanoa ferruginea TaxID=53367 RepID=A0A3D9ZKV2_9ACTN|nr:hypothetical protein [Asanoa ferruginea]REF97841.1 hypothetical protein DFJ67_3848 [Asanoa ferruginea]GIF52983.1 hypothetical protein Afe04nite_75220 [Asanoa ferruginea]